LNARTLAALARWHLGCLGTIDAIAATLLGLLLGVVCAWSATDERTAAAEVACAGGTFAIAFASSPRATRAARSLFLFSAPLYGRELARGLALAPCLLATLFPLAACAGWSLQRATHASLWLLPLLAAIVAALVSLSATLRDAWRVVLYRALAFGSASCLAASSLLLGNDPASRIGLACAALTLGFFALRAFGETLARYDPVADA
jgi:hypothetical protein